MKKLITISIISAILIITAFFFCSRNKQPDIVFIIIDTLRADHTHMGDGEAKETPELKKMFENDSAFFGTAWSNAPWTLPSISSMITSKYPTEIGVVKRNSKIDEKFLTIAEELKKNGYSTHGVISHIFLKKKYGLAQGFDTYIEKIDSSDNNLLAITSPGVTAEAIKIINGDRKKPLFMFLHYFDPHYRYIDHDSVSNYKGPFLPEENDAKKAEIIKNNRFSGDDLEYFRECYRSEIRFTDLYVEKVINELKSKGLYDNTLIVIVSDHGEEFGERGTLGHGQSLFNEQTKVPFILKLPGNSRNKVIKRKVFSNIDISPTLLDAAGIKIPDSFSGRSIFNVKGPETVFMEVNESKYDTLYNQCAIVHDGWKLIKNFEDGKFELYDLRIDESEKNDQYTSNKKMFFSMHKILKRYIKMIETNKHVSQKTNLTEEEQKKLETLGYIGN
ncbi:MAG: sulfatase [Acidobacteriota bacterium]